MTSVGTARGPAPAPAAPAARTRTSDRQGSDGPSAGASGFDAVLAGHAAPPKPPQQARVKPSPEAQRRATDQRKAFHPSDQPERAGRPERAGSALKTPRVDSVRPDSVRLDSDRRDEVATNAGEQVSPFAADQNRPIEAEVNPPSATGAGAVLVPESSTPPAPVVTSNTPAASILAPGAGHADPNAAVAAGAASGQGSSVATEALPVSLGQPSVAPGTADPAQPVEAEVSSAAVARLPIAPGLGGVPATSTPAAAAAASDLAGSAAAVFAATASDTAAPATDSTASAAPIRAQGKSSADPAAAGDVSAIPGSTGQAGLGTTKVVPGSLGEPVIVDTAAGSSQPQQGAEVTGAGGAATAPAVGVIPLLAGPVSPASASTASAAPASWLPASVPAPAHHQVLTAVSPLLRGADGSYAIELQLHPKDLGAVQVTVDVRRGEISIQMNAPDGAARDALRGGLSDLRQQLEDQGLRAGSMDVGSGGANARQPETSRPRSRAIEIPMLGRNPSDQPAPTSAASSTALDLRM